jgi:RNA polymerase sigma factor (sigma-70 family)
LKDEAIIMRVEPYLQDLKHYCLKLTGNEWDSQDLMQETLAKVYRSLERVPDRELTKAYFHQIASRTWIDHHRSKGAQASSSSLEEAAHQPSSAGLSEMAVRETFEQLASLLNARQMVLILLVDILQFTGPEAAQLLHTTVGAVKEGLKRARLRLQALAEAARDGGEEAVRSYIRKRQQEAGDRREAQTAMTNKLLFEQFLTGFRAGDAEAICRSYILLAENGIQVEKVASAGDQISFTVRDPNGHLIRFFQEL